jgi:hypothetical protein
MASQAMNVEKAAVESVWQRGLEYECFYPDHFATTILSTGSSESLLRAF